MKFFTKFKYLFAIIILIGFSCKKKSSSPILPVIRAGSVKTEKLRAIECLNLDFKCMRDSVYGFLILTRPNTSAQFDRSYVNLYFSKDTSPINNYYEGENKGNPENAHYLQNSTGQIYVKFQFENKFYELNTNRGFSNIILDTRYQPQGILSYAYKLRHDGPIINTDTILACTNQSIKNSDTLVILNTCNSIANYSKPTRFMINFLNYEYIKIGRKYFIIVKEVKHDFTNY